MNFFTVDILTPDKIVVKDIPAESLLVSTVKGQINILPEHTHIVTRLAMGQVSVFGGADDPDRHFAVSHGICKVLKNKVMILSHTSEECHEINRERAQLALKNALDHLESGKLSSDEEIEKFRRKAERAKLRIQLAEFSK